MKNFLPLQPGLDDQSYGSRFDPVLTGVAKGLESLFPPHQDIQPDPRREARGPADAPKPDRTETVIRS